MTEADGQWFIAASLIIDGSVAETLDFEDGCGFDYWVDQVLADYQSVTDRRQVWAIYTIEHDHAPDLDCECVQYLTDHHPYWSSANVS